MTSTNSNIKELIQNSDMELIIDLGFPVPRDRPTEEFLNDVDEVIKAVQVKYGLLDSSAGYGGGIRDVQLQAVKGFTEKAYHEMVGTIKDTGLVLEYASAYYQPGHEWYMKNHDNENISEDQMDAILDYCSEREFHSDNYLQSVK